jgi:hypothetical protein
VFPLTATPEREHHGAFLRALDAQAGRERVLALVDESGFRQRFGAEAQARLVQRRAAWEAVLSAEGHEPVFADLAAPPGTPATAVPAPTAAPASSQT